jgi:hypothetical protein
MGGPPRSGFPAWGIWAIIGGVVLIGAVVAIILLTGGEDEPPQQGIIPAPVTTAQSPVSDPAVDQLLAYLPAEATNCIETDLMSNIDAIAGVLCDLSTDARVTLDFLLYPSPEAALASFTSSAGTPNTGDCANGVEGEQGWTGGVNGGGRLLCGPIDDGRGGLFWTSNGFPVLGQVTSRAPDMTSADVYAVWQTIPDYNVV